MNHQRHRCTTPLVAVVLIAVSGCAQHSASTLPATPAIVRSAIAKSETATPPSQHVKVNFPTPVDLDEGLAPSVSWQAGSSLIEEFTNGAKLFYRYGNFLHDNVTWGKAVPIGDGTQSSITYVPQWSAIVDVHREAKGLFYHVGNAHNSTINWGQQPTIPYDDGRFPRVTWAGDLNLVEVDDSGNGQIAYHLGTLDPNKSQIDFGKRYPLGAGYGASVTANSNGTAIELHSGSSEYGESHLYYRVGQIDTKTKTIAWGDQVAVPNTGSSVSNVAWSHEGYIVVTYMCSAPSPFDFRYLCTTMGTLNSDNKTISWYGASRSALNNSIPLTLSTALAHGDAVTTLEVAGSASAVSRTQYAASLLSDRANWEGDRLASSLKGKSLHGIVFPASHDAGMYLDYSGGGGAEALAQDQDLYGQLGSGQRYFDLRPDYNLRFYHGPIDGPLVQAALDDVKKFMNEGHREVVILKFSHFCFKKGTTCDNQGPVDVTDPNYIKLLQMIQSTLGSWLYTNNTGRRLADVPLSELLKSHGVVLPLMDQASATGKAGIYTYRDWESADNPAGGEFTAFDQFANSEIYNTMKNDQLTKFSQFTGKMKNAPATPCDFFLLSWTLTPISLVYTVAPVADAHLGPVMATTRRNSFGRIPNILYLDFAEWADPADVAIGMNERL